MTTTPTSPPTSPPWPTEPSKPPSNNRAIAIILVLALGAFVALGAVVNLGADKPHQPPPSRYALTPPDTTAPARNPGDWLSHTEGGLHNVATDMNQMAADARADNLAALFDDCDSAYVFRDDLAAAVADIPASEAVIRRPLEAFLDAYERATDACLNGAYTAAAGHLQNATEALGQARAALDAYRASH